MLPILLKNSNNPAARTRVVYPIEAAVDYFISLTVTGAFLTILIKQMGVSDSLNGIISSLVTVSATIQIFTASFMGKRRSVRRTSLFLQIAQHLLYALLYLLPFFRLGAGVQVVLFTVIYLAAACLCSMVSSAKFSWLNSFVEPGQRGIYSARKEMISLISGIIYNYIMSRVLDHYAEVGELNTGFLICAVSILVLMVIHIVLMLLTADAPQIMQDLKNSPSLGSTLKINFSNPVFRKLLLVTCGWNFFCYLSISYYSVYMISDIGVTVTFIAIAGIVSSLVRTVFSPRLGKYADKNGFASALQLGFLIAGVSNICMTLCCPGVLAKPMYILYVSIHALSMGTLNSSLLNILFQYIPKKDCMGAMGLYSAIGGLIGFGGSLLGGWILATVQANGNRVMGLPLYGQQLLSVLTVAGLVLLVIYMRKVIAKLPRLE